MGNDGKPINALGTGIIHAYIAGVVGTINAGVARGRMQPWQASSTFMQLFTNVIDMQTRLETSNNLDMNKILPFLQQAQAQQSVQQLSQVEDKVSNVEKVLTDNPDIVKQIMAKLPE